MILQAGDLGILIDFGDNLPGSVLQRKEGGKWRDYEVDRRTVTAPIDVNSLPPGEYRLVLDPNQ
jgi:hypothetical protein